ncbi:sensor histidine kinase [Fibrella sp. WM1]|uniref:sensor histidine kinase n=1 Tax=Fibrella musci TaxID=3242485 RepID=UPI0035230A4F
MSTKRIRWIVLSMALGLLGLVGFQLYWISTALHLQKEQFDYKVTDALQEVVRSLERQEIQYQARQQLQLQHQQQQLMAIGRKNGKAAATQATARPTPSAAAQDRVAATPMPSRQRTQRTSQAQTGTSVAGRDMPGPIVVQSDALHPRTQTLTLEQAQVVEAFFRQQEELMAMGDWQTQLAQQQRFERWINEIAANPLNQFHDGELTLVMPDSGTHRARPTRQRKTRTYKAAPLAKTAPTNVPKPAQEQGITAVNSMTHAEQAQMIKDVLKGLLMSDRPLEERVDRFTLDTLLRQALQERGITIPYNFAVRNKGQSRFLFASMLASQASMNRQFDDYGYKAALFPNNILETGNYVYLFFPDQRSFILSRMTATLAGSALLILVIMGCFYVAITTILRQKKMADIKNDFINNMTHEFKTPISTISLAVDMAREQLRSAQMPALVGAAGNTAPSTELPERLGRYMGIIRDENQRLGSHVEKVLQMALLDKGEVKLKLSSVNVHDVIEKVLNTMSLSIEQRQGDIELEFDATDEIVQADEVHLTNMLYNLIDNAIKYSPERVAIRIRTRNTTLPDPKTGAPRPSVAISVADQGLGLTKEQQSRIFDTFYRVPTGNRHDVKGFGLGLSYVKKMAEEHHGQVTVSSTPGQGSEFEIVIPTT